MGYYGTSILGHSLTMGDWEFDHIKKSQSREYYENYKIEVEYEDDKRKKKTLKFPLTHFGKIRKNRLHYRFEVDQKRQDWFRKPLFDLLVKNKVDLSCQIYYGIYSREYAKYVFLNSAIVDDQMTFSNYDKRIYVIKTYDELLWVIKQGLEISK